MGLNRKIRGNNRMPRRAKAATTMPTGSEIGLSTVGIYIPAKRPYE